MNKEEIKAAVMEALREYDNEKMEVLRRAEDIKWEVETNASLGIYPVGSFGWRCQQYKKTGVWPSAHSARSLNPRDTQGHGQEV